MQYSLQTHNRILYAYGCKKQAKSTNPANSTVQAFGLTLETAGNKSRVELEPARVEPTRRNTKDQRKEENSTGDLEVQRQATHQKNTTGDQPMRQRLSHSHKPNKQTLPQPQRHHTFRPPMANRHRRFANWRPPDDRILHVHHSYANYRNIMSEKY